MFAGPNGSGKSTFKLVVRPDLLGVYINPDEIEAQLRGGLGLDFQDYGIRATNEDVEQFFSKSTLLNRNVPGEAESSLRFEDGKLHFTPALPNSYVASVAADFIRTRLLSAQAAFTFETVMSHPGKIELLRAARASDYRTYLYYVATDDPGINIARVGHRVKMGGHAVPEDRIVSRYRRSLDLLLEAVRNTDRAYVFDNSGQGHVWLAEITSGSTLELRSELLPEWFQIALWNEFTSAPASA